MMLVTFFSCASIKNIKPDWTNIIEVHYYGSSNPDDDRDADFIEGDPIQIKNIFSNLIKTDHHFPKGPSHYATIKLSNKKNYTIQIIRTPGSPFRILGKKSWAYEWYEVEGKKWDEYIRHLSVQFLKKQRAITPK